MRWSGPRTVRKTITSGEMRWNPIFNRLEYESETKTTYGEKSFRIRIYRGRRHVENGSSFSVAVVGGRKGDCGF